MPAVDTIVHGVASPVMTLNLLLLAAPLLGALIDVAFVIALGRLLAGNRLLSVIFAAFAAGLALTVLIALWALAGAQLPVLEAGALLISVLIVYFGAGFIIFAVINLGETSLRIRLLGKLIENPTGLTEDDLVADYDDSTLIDVRLQRLKVKQQVRFADGIYRQKPSLLFFAAAVVRTLKATIYRPR